MRIVRYITILFLIGLFITTTILPGLSRDILPLNQIAKQASLTNAQNLVQQGQKYYQTEKYQQSINNLKQAADIYANLKDLKSEAIVRSNLSLAHQKIENWQQAQTEIFRSFNLLEFNYDLIDINTLNLSNIASDKLPIIANIINIYGRWNYFQNNLDNALNCWRSATKIYQKLDNNQGIVTSQINQLQALQALGLYQEAKSIAETVNKNLNDLPDKLKIKALISLGNVFRINGDLAGSEYVLKQSLGIAKHNNSLDENDITTSNLSLANTWQSRGNLEQERSLPIRYEYFPWRLDVNQSSPEAIKYYKKAESQYQQLLSHQVIDDSLIKVKTQINLLKLLITTGQWTESERLINKIQLSALPNSRTKVYTQIILAKNLAYLKQQNVLVNTSWDKIINLITKAIENAELLKDNRAKSYAIANLGGLYEYFSLEQKNQSQQWRKQAIQLTQEALYLAQPNEMPDIAYQWQWQLGRLAKAGGNTKESIKHYQDAVQTLAAVRGDLVAINSDIQFSFRDNIEPVYRQLAQLLLQQPIQQNLIQTRQLVQNLQLAELENFLRCNLENTQALDKIANRVDSTEAIIYPIVLDKEIDVILKLPNDSELRYHNTKIPRGELDRLVQRLQNNLARPDARKKVQEDSHKLYQLLIAPIATDLKQAEVNTLVFFLDTPLRNIPMAVLYDGNQYLIENYAVAITSGLELLATQTASTDNLNAILAGLTKSVRGRLPLRNVDRQFNQISTVISNEILLDEQFTVSNFQNQLQSLPFPVVHIATHGQFSSQPEATFIEAWDDLINLDKLSSLLKNSQTSESEAIELLVLAACETAQGDKRATLGLAGVAINAGARSTLATLWKVSADNSPAKLLSQFYQKLIDDNTLTKAQALQQAQKEFLKDDNLNRPYFWASYVLLGSWL